MIARLKLWFAGAALAVSVLFAAYFSGKVNGKSAVAMAAHKQAAESLRKAKSIEKASDKLPIDGVRDRIAKRVRD